MTNLIAKPIIKNQYWVVTDGDKKVGNVLATPSGFNVELNGTINHFQNTSEIKKKVSIDFKNPLPKKTTIENPFPEFPTPKKFYNSMLDVRRRLHLFTSSPKSKCYRAAGWFVVKQDYNPEVIFCPKYIFIQRYEYMGPFKTEDEAKIKINIS